jgi:hypothetical protein
MRLRTLAFCGLPLILLFRSSVLAQPVINEVMWMGTDLSTSDEWVEILGTGSGTVFDQDISGWSLTTLNSKGQEAPIIVFGTGTVLGSGSMLVVSRFDADHSRLLAPPASVTPDMSLPNTKLQLRLRDRLGRQVDSADDGIGAPFAGENPKAPAWKASMERINASLAGDSPTNWQSASTFVGFDDGAPLYGTPGAKNGSGPSLDRHPPAEVAGFTGSLISQGSGARLQLAWRAGLSLDASGYILTFSPSIRGNTGSIVLPPSAVNFAMETSSGASGAALIRTFDTSGNVSPGTKIYIQPLYKPISLSSSSAESSSAPSSSMSNTAFSSVSTSSEGERGLSLTLPVRMRISELLSDPLDAETNQWIELQNQGSGSVDLRGWKMGILTSSVRYVFSTGSVLHSGDEVSFRRSVTGISLPHAGGTVVLVRPDGSTEDTFAYGTLPQGVSAGRLPGTDDIAVFCVPTEGQPNAQREWVPSVELQSGSFEGEGSTSFNIQITNPYTPPDSCAVDNGDGSGSASCNPPSHTIDVPGHYSLHIKALNQCGNTVERTIPVIINAILKTAPEAPIPGVVNSRSSSSFRSSASDGRSSSAPASKSQSVYTALVLSRALPNPAGADSGKEWVEISQSGSSTANLTGWMLVTAKDPHHPFALSGSLAPAASRRIFLPLGAMHMQNGADAIILRDPQGKSVSQIAWDKADTDVRYPLLAAASASSSSGDMEALSSESAEITAVSPDLQISEIFPFSKGSGVNTGSGEWIELYNKSEQDLDLNRWSIHAGASRRAVRFSTGTVVPSGEYAVVRLTAFHVPLSDGGGDVVLLDPHGAEVDARAYPKMKTGRAFAASDGQWCETEMPTPGAENICRIAGKATVSKAVSKKKVAAAKSPKTTTPASSGDTIDVPAAAGMLDVSLASLMAGTIGGVAGSVLERRRLRKE